MSEEENKISDLQEEEAAPADSAEEEKPSIGEIVTGTATSQPSPDEGAVAASSNKLAGLPLGAWVAIAVVALVLGVIIGFFAFGPKTPSNAVSGSATLEEGKLDSVVATYTVDGKEASVTAQEVLENAGALEYYMDEDGNYRLPSAEMTISYVRNKLLLAEAEKRGISVSDDELTEYAVQQIGTSDFEMLATSYGMSEDSIRSILTTSLVLEKLQEEVASDEGSDLVMPEEPPAPAPSTTDDEAVEVEDGYEDESDEYADYEDSESSSASSQDEEADDGLSADEAKQYADYIIALAGDEWDSATGTWASPDGEYASALAMYDVTADSASYEAAMTAYYVAYQRYALASSGPAEKWEQFTNDIFSKATVTLYTLVA